MVALILVTYAILVPVLFAYRTWPFDGDESVHATAGLQLAADLRGGRIGDLITNAYFQRWYPPLLSIYLAPFLSMFGPSYWAARFPLLLLLPVNLALLYRVGRLIWQRWEPGVVAVLLGATCPIAWMLALLCMEEGLAMTGLLLLVAGYTLAARGERSWLWPGVTLAVTFLARISTGAFAGIALCVACWTGRGTLREKAKVTGQLLGPLTVTAFFWWAHPDKLLGLQDYFLASTPRQSSFTWPLLTNSWWQLLSTYTVGWAVGTVAIASIALSLVRWKEPVVRFLLSLFLVTWSALVLQRQLAPRLFFAASPSAFLLTGYWATNLFTKVKKRMVNRRQSVRNILIGGFALYFLAAVTIRRLSFPFLMEVAYEADPRSAEARAWIAQRTRTEKVFLVNGWDQFSASALSWYLAGLKWPHWEIEDVVHIELQDPAESPEAVTVFQEAVQASPEAKIVHLGNTPVPQAGAWWAYRASLTACWDGEWQATAGFLIKLWDDQLAREILAHPMHFVLERDRAAARQSLWYDLFFEVHIATCKIHLENYIPAMPITSP
jgi:4-amino-4-deoxy-L-arabinose transferase-like glycosyltransferase